MKLAMFKKYNLTSTGIFETFNGTVIDILSYSSAIKRDFELDTKNRIANGANINFADDEVFYHIKSTTDKDVIIADSWIDAFTTPSSKTVLGLTDVPDSVLTIIKEVLTANSVTYKVTKT